ncbi:hypothetical protein QTP70_009413 [Hemibagrus guttatus]|uniref:Reverse transcriptase domain-containing protein n=1 Tax=Hemibagrus guttatus TaxID=175788 RepID=A0AAE0Q9B4_9TELE|nr:hypothetical protein QTP70_009413 [Hemibagrus guttatus]
MKNNLHDPNQSGFKAAHSTETALLAVTEKLHAARSAKLSSVLILLDLSAAFDTVNHKTLLSTLRSLGVCGTAWEWFASYLDGRSYQFIQSLSYALIDSGSAVNIIDSGLIEKLRLHTIPCVPLLRVTAITNQPIREGFLYHHTPPLDLQIGLFHQEKMTFYVIASPANPIVLGLPWLQLHDPLISWREGELVCWSHHCLYSCFLHAKPRPCLTMTVGKAEPNSSATLPEEYKDLGEVFSKENATCLPLHRPWDCAIEFLPNAMPPKNRVYPLSLPESKAMDEYIEALSFGFIRPSNFSCRGRLFLHGEKGWGSLSVYRLQRPQHPHRALPLPSAPGARSAGTTTGSTNLH